MLGVLHREFVPINGDFHGLEIGLDAALLVPGDLLDGSGIWTNGQVHVADLHIVQALDGFLV